MSLKVLQSLGSNRTGHATDRRYASEPLDTVVTELHYTVQLQASHRFYHVGVIIIWKVFILAQIYGWERNPNESP